MPKIGELFNPRGSFTGSWIPEVIEQSKDLKPCSKLVYARLLRYAGNDGRAFPKQSTIAENLGISESGVKKSIKQLVELGYIYIEKGNPLKHQSNSYFFLYHKDFDRCLSEVPNLPLVGSSHFTPPLKDEENQLKESESNTSPSEYIGEIIEEPNDSGMVEVANPPGISVTDDGKVMIGNKQIGTAEVEYNSPEDDPDFDLTEYPPCPKDLAPFVVQCIESKFSRRFSLEGNWLNKMRAEIGLLYNQLMGDHERIRKAFTWYRDSDSQMVIDSHYTLRDKFSKLEACMNFKPFDKEDVPNDDHRLLACGVDVPSAKLPPKPRENPAAVEEQMKGVDWDKVMKAHAAGTFEGLTEEEYKQAIQADEYKEEK